MQQQKVIAGLRNIEYVCSMFLLCELPFAQRAKHALDAGFTWGSGPVAWRAIFRGRERRCWSAQESEPNE
jgi:hypothetical protein